VRDVERVLSADRTADGPEAGEGTEPSAAGLSEAEHRVAALAAAGFSNRRIASRLFITVSTVEQHLTRIYRKLGVTRRGELATVYPLVDAGIG
jgi:DNA-binding CsgD family transcriptional regulator